ncbi:hypothetical protein DY000_02055787 [Brassica cretica]|uniref:Uncharacterized protein n=1 Tax=Brassica cretica TaxID=69181 RepID=A0ABQ7AIM8_BRACR|nr:hypothetical protein DY000_02055787 [Brassica cretica]
MMRNVGSSSSSGKGIAAVVGVGPQLGRSVARKFAHEGYTVAILARDLVLIWYKKVIPGMMDKGKGTILFSGCSASLNGVAGFSELCCGKFALRALSQCLAREYQAFGIHVAHVIIDGVVGPPRERNIAPRGTVAEQSFNTGGQDGEGEGESSGVMGMDPDVLAQTYWSLHVQDQRAWTQELDIRPSNTRF